MINGDTVLIAAAASSFLLFLGCQMIVFRRIHNLEVLHGIMYIAVGVGTVGAIGMMVRGPTLFLSVFFTIVYEAVYGMLVVLYVFGWFVNVESSITLRLLYEIAKADREGATASEIALRYNRDTIVTRRLARLVAIGEIEKRGDVYVIGRKKSFFSVRNILARILNVFFPPLSS